MKNFRKPLAGLVILLLSLSVFGFVGCQTDASDEGPDLFTKTGTFIGESTGIFGTIIQVELKVDRKKILGISVDHYETHGFGDVAIDKMRNEMMARQVIEVDIVSGATGSSAGFADAVYMAAEAAGGIMDRLGKVKNQTEYKDETVHVVVMGSGVAGHTAAISLKLEKPDWKVVLIEKVGVPGGNSARASVNYGGGNYSKFHIEAGAAQPTTPAEPTNNNGHAGRITALNPIVYANYIYDAGGRAVVTPINAMSSGLGSLRLPDNRVPGSHMLAALTLRANAVGVDIRVNNDGYELVQPDGPGTKVTGLKIGVNPSSPNTPAPASGRNYDYTYTLTATEGVVITSGGFCQDTAMKNEYLMPILERDTNFTPQTLAAYKKIFVDDLWATASEALTGDGQKIAKKAGADLGGMDMHSVRYHVVRVPNTRNGLSMASISSRASILVSGNTGKHLALADSSSNFHRDGLWEEDANSMSQVWSITNHRNHVNEIGNLRDYFISGLLIHDLTLNGLADKMKLSAAAKTNFLATMEQIITESRQYAPAYPAAATGWPATVSRDNLVALSSKASTYPAGTGAALTSDFTAKIADTTEYPLGVADFRNPVYDGMRKTYAWHWGSSSGTPTNATNAQTALAPFYAFISYPTVHGTGGGVKIDLAGRALTADNEIIPGLYAAGTSSFFGRANPTTGAYQSPMSSQNVANSGAVGHAVAMAIVGKPLYTELNGRAGPTATAAPMLHSY